MSVPGHPVQTKKRPHPTLIKVRPICMRNNIRLASYPPQGKDLEASMLQKSGVICLIVICVTLLIFMWITRSSLCEVRVNNNNINVAVIMDCGS